MVNNLWGFFIGVGLIGYFFKFLYNLDFQENKKPLAQIFEQEVLTSIWNELFIQK
jgi:hypothetical protein